MSNRIDQYVIQLRRQIEESDAIANTVLRKILYVVILDTLSKAAFPASKQHRRRVIQFIDTCSNWADKDRVSAQQLLLALQNKGVSSGLLFEAIQNRVFSWQSTMQILPIHDHMASELVKLVGKNEWSLVQSACYKELYYYYRNSIIHEFREPGHGIDLFDIENPYYHSLEAHPWQLVFPPAFLKKLCLQSLDGLTIYLRSNHMDPLAAYNWDSLWYKS